MGPPAGGSAPSTTALKCPTGKATGGTRSDGSQTVKTRQTCEADVRRKMMAAGRRGCILLSFCSFFLSASWQPVKVHCGSSEGSGHGAEEKFRPLQRRTDPCRFYEHLNIFCCKTLLRFPNGRMNCSVNEKACN